jgi:CBS domain containing-hemolysin-like protein
MAVDEAATLLKTTWETVSATVGGLVTAALGHLPAPGEVITIGDYELEVEQVTDRAIRSVLARRVTPEPVEVHD